MEEEYRLVLERVVGRDESGFPTTVTVIEVTDTPDTMRSTWIPALGARLGVGGTIMPPGDAPADTGDEARPKRGRRTRAQIEADEAAAKTGTPPVMDDASQFTAAALSSVEGTAALEAVRKSVNPFSRKAG